MLIPFNTSIFFRLTHVCLGCDLWPTILRLGCLEVKHQNIVNDKQKWMKKRVV